MFPFFYRLDKKSSRGMIYENEELRLRTININAEVSEGQSNIRKLRSENDRLKREIWSLKDNYDKLKRKYRKREESKYSSDHHHHGASCSNSEVSSLGHTIFFPNTISLSRTPVIHVILVGKNTMSIHQRLIVAII